MTIKPWVISVKDSHELTVYNGLTSGKWVHIFKVALQLFNGLGLPVKLTQAKDERSSNVVMRVSSGVASYEYDGTPLSHPLDGKILHGYTMQISREGQKEIEKAVVFLPSDPQYNAGFIRGKQVFEKANLEMMKVITVHELIHACGLENEDHADDGVFAAHVTPQNGKLVAFGGVRAMPPLFLTPSTVSKVANLW